MNKNKGTKSNQSAVKNSKYFIYAKSCPRRSLDASKLHKYLIENNMQPVSDQREADLIFVYTCGGFNYWEERSIRTIEKALENKSAKVVVTGCLPKVNPKILDGFRGTHIMDPDDFGKIDELVNAKAHYGECGDCSIVNGVHPLYDGGFFERVKRNIRFNPEARERWVKYLQSKIPHRSKGSFSVESNSTYKLEIARGCLGNCSYCAIKIAMPKFKSHSEEQILKKFQYGLRENYQDFALIAGDIGCYGIDINTNLPSLLEKLLAVEGKYKILLVDLNARWFVKYYSELLPILKANAQKIAGIIVPIQSGSNRILKLMNRHYEIGEAKKCIRNLLENIPKIKIETHILVGFPGETDEDFGESLDLVKEIPFSNVLVYAYEDRPNTKASELPDKIPENVIKNRRRTLRREFKAQRLRARFSF
jgi:tRNA A37 methylthiotransferase MiaB